jgi:hypothetical protein
LQPKTPSQGSQEVLRAESDASDRSDSSSNHDVKPEILVDEAPSRPKKQEPPSTSLERYNRVVAAADLDSIRMNVARFSTIPDPHRLIAASENAELRAHISHRVAEPAFDTLEGRGSCVVSFLLQLRDSKNAQLMRANCEFQVLYTGLEHQDPISVRRYIARVGRFAAYPYFRAFVGHVASLAEISLPALPVLKENSSPSGHVRRRL